MKPNNPLLAIALSTAVLLAANAGAHEPKAQDMKGHDMSSMQAQGMKGHDMSSMQAQGMKGHDMSKMQGQDMKGHSAGSMELHKAMMSGMKMPMKMSGNVDKDFASMMSMHHQQATRMVDVYVKHGRNTELKALARKMKAAQQGEIKQMASYAK